MENIVLKKKDGKVEVMNLTPSISKKLNNGEVHLCWGSCHETFCKHACSSECSKVADKRKRTLEQYPFITDGFQIMDEDGRVEQFVVTGCSKYEPAGEKELTREEKQRINSAKRGLKTLYFEAADVDEASIKQYMEVVRGTITNINSNMLILPEKSIIDRVVRHKDAEQLLKEILIYKVKQLINCSKKLRNQFEVLYGSEKIEEILENKHLTVEEAHAILKDAKKILTDMMIEYHRTNNSLSNLEISKPYTQEDYNETKDIILRLAGKSYRMSTAISTIRSELDFVEKINKLYQTKANERMAKEEQEAKILKDLYDKGVKEKKIVKR